MPSNRFGALAGIAGGLLLAAVVLLLQLVEGRGVDLLALLVAAPLLTAALAPIVAVLAVGGVCLLATIGWSLGEGDLLHPGRLTVLVVLVAVTGLAVVVARFRETTAGRVAQLSRLAAVAQQAVLQPAPPRVGNLNIAVRYISASAGADIGGDLYEVQDTQFGTRVLVGDVRGKGLGSVRLASSVLGSFRHVAHERSDLRAVVADLDRAVARSGGEEDFVTATVASERGGTFTILNCGHPSPLLIRAGKVIPLDPPGNAPPLGFLPVALPRVQRLEPGDRLLFYTDGLTEARREGEFFPLPERAAALLSHGTVGDALKSLESAMVDWVDGLLDDDIALVVLEYTGARDEGEQARPASAPSWEMDTAGD